jgi:rod shape-determining protein MreC
MAIVIRPAADLTRLEEVLVITGTSTTLPLAAQADADKAEATAEATAEESKRAADVLAEKLPSVGDDAQAKPQIGPDGKPVVAPNPDQIGGVPGVPNSGLPKVTPAVHPDRYTPGATPPAEDLRPGAPEQSQGSQSQSSQPQSSQPQTGGGSTPKPDEP